MISKAPMTLREFHDTFVLPEVTDQTSSANGRRYRQTIRKYEQFRGREVLITDFTPGRYFDFKDWLIEHNSRIRADQLIAAFLAMWRMASRKGLSEACPIGSAVPQMRGGHLNEGGEP